MGWLNRFFRFFNLFKKKKVIEIVPLKLEQLDEWLLLQSKELINKFNLNQVVKNYSDKLKEKQWLLECYLDLWEERVNDKEIKIFFTETRKKVLEKITFPETIEISEVSQLISSLEEVLEKLIGDIEKSPFAHHFTFILNEEEKKSPQEIIINPLLKELIEISGLIKEIKQKITQSGFRKIESLIAKKQELETATAVINELQEKREPKKEKLSAAEEKKKEKEEEFLELKKNPVYLQVNDRRLEKKMIATKMEETRNRIITIFAKFKPLLEQYKLIYPEKKIIDAYLKDPHHTFLEDEGLIILHILGHCRAALHSKKFLVQKEKREEILSSLEKAYGGYLSALQHEYFALRRKMQSFESSLEDHDFISKIEEVQYRLDHFSKQVDLIQDEIALIEAKIDEHRDIQQASKVLFENMVRIGLGKGIEIKI